MTQVIRISAQKKLSLNTQIRLSVGQALNCSWNSYEHHWYLTRRTAKLNNAVAVCTCPRWLIYKRRIQRNLKTTNTWKCFSVFQTWTVVKSPWLHLIQIMAKHTKFIVKLGVHIWLNFITCVSAKMIKAFALCHNICKLRYQFLLLQSAKACKS